MSDAKVNCPSVVDVDLDGVFTILDRVVAASEVSNDRMD